MNRIAIVELNSAFAADLAAELKTVKVETVIIPADAKTVPEDVKGAVIAAVEGDELCIPESIYELPVPVYPAKGEDLLPRDRWMRKCTLDEFVFFTVKIEVE